MRIACLTLTAALIVTTGLPAQQAILPKDRPIESVIDQSINEKLRDAGVAAAPQISDQSLIRRLTLDLAGRIPTEPETRAFSNSTDPNKRANLVDALISSPALARHLANQWDSLLSEGNRGGLREYLVKAFGENRSWDRIFRELMLPDESDPKQKGASAYLLPRLKDVDRLTADVTSTFFGVNISCAQCHDHPKVEAWKQEHFYGMKSFFSRTFDNGGFIGERGYGSVKFKTTGGKEVQAKLMFITGAVVEASGQKEPGNEDQKRERETLERFKREKKPPPPPSFSARTALVNLALKSDENNYLAKAVVNRIWYQMFGHGLVMPMDQMHSENPPSHPELLEWLASDTKEHGFDLRRLIRGIAMSQAYSRTSKWTGTEPPKPSLFAVAIPRALTPMQLATSLKVATLDPGRIPPSPSFFETMENSARGVSGLFEFPREDFQIGAGEALVFSNSDRLQKEVLAEGGDRLVTRLQQLTLPEKRIEFAFQVILNRAPDAEEARVFGDYLRQRLDRSAEATRHLVWALLTSSEFRFNH